MYVRTIITSHLKNRLFEMGSYNRLADPAATITWHPLHTANGFMLATVQASPFSIIALAGTIF